MVYTSGGQVLSERSPWRMSIVADTIWGFINVVVLFFMTMFQPDLTSKGRGMDSNYQSRPGQGPGGPGPRRRFGGLGGRGGGPSAPPMAGGG